MPDDPIWSPTSTRVETSRLYEFAHRFAPECANYEALHRWSVTEPDAFWSATAAFCGLGLSQAASAVVTDFDRMPGARWFCDARLNYAQNLLAGDAERVAIVAVNERGERRELTLGELRQQVASLGRALAALGVEPGDRVAGVLPNGPECIVAMLASASIGAVWSSCSPEFGAASLRDRLSQTEPKILFGIDGYTYGGRHFDCLPTLRELIARLPSIETLVLSDYAGSATGLLPDDRAIRFGDLLGSGAARGVEPDYRQLPFDHPLFIMFSSGTTGPPKCIVHGAGGTLLQHLKEHQLHTDIGPGDRVFYYTTTGWMMWNWLASALASGASLILYDGAPMHPDPGTLWRLAEQESVSVFGTSARYLAALEQSGYRPRETVRLDSLRAILSTGSPLAPASFDFVYREVARDLQLASIAGGTDLISCFVLGNPMLPVYRGEIQCRGLGMDVRIFDAEGRELTGQKGELVCASPFPSMPVGFWNDPAGEAYHRAYFERYPGIWHHGDFAELTDHGGIVMYGRSDATLNPGGIRIGTAEIYRILEQIPGVVDAVVIGQSFEGDTRIVLFVELAAGTQLDAALEEKIRSQIRRDASPHHLPRKILVVPDIPKTLNGKTSERAVSDAVHGRPIANLTALANPESIAAFQDRPELAS